MRKDKETILSEKSFLVSETDLKGICTFANKEFCRIREYNIDELIGSNHNIVRHPDMPKRAFEDLWNTIKRGKNWTGYVKNKTKSGGYYWVYRTVFPMVNSEGEKRYLSCRRIATREEIDFHDKLYKEMIKEEKGLK